VEWYNIVDASDHEVDQVIDRARAHVEAGCGGTDDAAGLRNPQHVRQIDLAKRHFARDQNQAARLFESDGRGTPDKISGQPGRDAGQRVAAARTMTIA
jgi:hypothetical protein